MAGWPFKIPMTTRNATVFIIAPAVMQSINHLASVLRMLNLGCTGDSFCGSAPSPMDSSMALSSMFLSP